MVNLGESNSSKFRDYQCYLGERTHFLLKTVIFLYVTSGKNVAGHSFLMEIFFFFPPSVSAQFLCFTFFFPSEKRFAASNKNEMDFRVRCKNIRRKIIRNLKRK